MDPYDESVQLILQSSSSSSSSSSGSNQSDEELEEMASMMLPVLQTHAQNVKEYIRCLDFKGEHGGSVHGRRYKWRLKEIGLQQLEMEYFLPNCVHDEDDFRRRFRMSRRLFLRILEGLGQANRYWTQMVDAVGKFGIHPKLKMTAALRVLSYGISSDSQDDYCKMGESTTSEAMKSFCETVLQVFGDEYLRPPTEADLERILEESAARGFPGCLGSIDCTHWTWKNCPSSWRGAHIGHHKDPTLILEAVATRDLWIWHSFFGLPGSCNDINVLDRSPIFNDYKQGHMPTVNFEVNGNPYHLGYYLADGIYPTWATFVKTISVPHGAAQKYFVTKQESARKDIERAFGVLKARWHILARPCLLWYEETMGIVMRACIVLHNMIVEDERGDNVRQYIPDYELTDHDVAIRGNVQAMLERMTVRLNLLESPLTHNNLKKDLIQHLWNRRAELADENEDA